tara:strand:- start:1861 stop:2073 length:213 start_codon:yes stop_codon:yes gene_type:complete
MVKVGSIVKYVPSPSALFKWKTYIFKGGRTSPGIVMREIDEKGTTTRRFEVRWQNGKITEEWITYLEIFE